MISPCIFHEHNKEPHLLKKPVLINDALYHSASVILALLPAAGRLPTLYIQQVLFQPFSKVNFHCSLFSLASQESKVYVFEHGAFGFMLVYLSLQHLLQLVNLLGVFS